jgi:hypothetical protein
MMKLTPNCLVVHEDNLRRVNPQKPQGIAKSGRLRVNLVNIVNVVRTRQVNPTRLASDALIAA